MSSVNDGTATSSGGPAQDSKVQQSQLLELPAEIHLNILRYLLVHSEPISFATKSTTKKPKPFSECDQGFIDGIEYYERPLWRYVKVPNFRFSVQILGVCKMLLREGWPLLYNDNQLKLHLYFDQGLMSPFRDDASDEDPYPLWEVPSAVRQNISNVILDFEACEVGSLDPQRMDADIFCDIGDYIEGKAVTVDIHLGVGWRQGFSREPDKKEKEELLRNLYPFKTVRCASATVLLNGHIVEPEWAKVMESSEPAYGLWFMFILLEYFVSEFTENANERRLLMDECTKLWDTVTNWDSEAFFAGRAKILARMDRVETRTRAGARQHVFAADEPIRKGN